LDKFSVVVDIGTLDDLHGMIRSISISESVATKMLGVLWRSNQRSLASTTFYRETLIQ
jgi:hypothetical protein